eukprot:scaffold289927_cov32-Tisochrysis_lutea.AAC.3
MERPFEDASGNAFLAKWPRQRCVNAAWSSHVKNNVLPLVLLQQSFCACLHKRRDLGVALQRHLPLEMCDEQFSYCLLELLLHQSEFLVHLRGLSAATFGEAHMRRPVTSWRETSTAIPDTTDQHTYLVPQNASEHIDVIVIV